MAFILIYSLRSPFASSKPLRFFNACHRYTWVYNLKKTENILAAAHFFYVSHFVAVDSTEKSNHSKAPPSENKIEGKAIGLRNIAWKIKQVLKYETTFSLQNTRLFDVLSLSVRTHEHKMSTLMNASSYSTSGVIISQLRPIFYSYNSHDLFSLGSHKNAFFASREKTLGCSALKSTHFFIRFFTHWFWSCFSTDLFFRGQKASELLTLKTRWFSLNVDAVESDGKFEFSNVRRNMAKNGMASSLAPITYSPILLQINIMFGRMPYVVCFKNSS